jgi:hypothetical protein
MATNIETMWVSDQAQLQATVQTLVSQGGVVQMQDESQVQVFLKKKMNIIVLIVGLVLCIVPGLAYLLWYSTADQSQQITVKIGSPANIKTEHEHWYDDKAPDAAAPATPGALPTSTPGSEIPAPAPPAMPAPAPLPDPNTLPPPTPLA